MNKATILLCVIALGLGAQAQSLYEPDPPANAAFVRIVNISDSEVKGSIDAVQYGGVAPGQASSYRVVLQGNHTINAGASKSQNVLAKRFYTVIANGNDLLMLEDPASPGQAKAGLTLYNLSKAPAVSLKTDDGKTTVVADVAPNTLKTQPVNAIKVALATFNGASKIASFPATQLERGLSYSAFVYGEANALKAFMVRGSTQR